MECPSCKQFWSSDQHIPRIINCGHTICELCAKSRFSHNKLRCTECRSTHVFDIDRNFTDTDSDFTQKCISSLSKNFTLLSLINNKPIQQKIEEIEFQYCEEHNLPIHSYTEKPASELCDECIAEVSGMGLEIKTIPRVDEYFNGIIQEIQKKLKNSSEKVEALANNQKINEKFETQKAQSIVSGFFQKFLVCTDSVEVEIKERTKSLVREKNEFNDRVLSILQERKVLVEKLVAHMDYLAAVPEGDLVRNSQLIEELIQSSRFQEPLQIKSVLFYSNKAKKVKLKDIIESSCKIEILKKISTWNCRCKTVNQDGVITCINCAKFRPVETYSNLTNELSEISEQEITEFNLRRSEELSKVTELDKEEPQGTFFLVHVEWINNWKLFVFGKSNRTSSGPLPPGPITNCVLFENEECTLLKPNLIPSLDYKLMNSRLWEYLFNLYGGGPTLKRKKPSIYQIKPK